MISADLHFTIECCRRAFSTGEGSTVGYLAGDLNWGLLLQLARFHRVQGLVRRGIADAGLTIPSEVAELLSGDAKGIAVANLRAIAECDALLKAFESYRVEVVFLKGVTLGKLAYGNPALKAAADIDLLIAPENIEVAASTLRDLGYHSEIPETTSDPVRLASWHKGRKESLWASDDKELAIDLHTRVSDNAKLIPAIGVHSARQVVDVSGTRLPTLADEELFAYLCVHGASSAWFRLKWITDFAALIHGRKADEIERLYERSQELGAYRAADQALLLADALYGSLEGTDLKHRLLRDRLSRTLFNAALRQLSIAEEPTEVAFGTWRIHWTQLLLKPGLGFRLNEASRQVRDAIV